MKVTFYGTRGSTPVPDPDFVQFGGNTACILLTFDSGRIAILDAGTGIRKLGDDLIAASHEQYDNIFIGLSHTHWDHIQGFPFFEPAYDPKRRITVAICGKDRESKDLESIFSTQMQVDLFPVPNHPDDFLLEMEKECKKRFPEAFLAREGEEIKV